MRDGQAGPAAGLIAQVLLLAVLAGTTGLGAAGWVVGVACAVTIAAALGRGLARGPGDGLGPASWVTLARATLAVGVAALVADSFTQRHAGRAARDAGRRRARAGRGRRMAGAAHRDGDRAGRALRRRGRRVPDPRPQRLRRPRVRRVGARDRGGALPVPGRRVAAAVDARAAAAAPLAQARRGDAGDRADGRGRRGPAPGAHAGAPGRRAGAARGVGRRVRVVAVAPPGRHARAGAGGGGRTVRARAAARAHRRGAHGARPAGRLGRPGRAEPAERGSPLGAFARLPLELLVVVALAVLLPAVPRRALAVVAGVAAGRARAREGPRHGVLHGLRPAVQPRLRLELRGDRHRDAARRDRQVAGEPRRGRRVRARRRAPRRPGPGAAARHARRGRPPRLGAPGGRGARRASGWSCACSARRSPPRAPPPSPSARCGRWRPACRIGEILAREIARDRFRATPGDRLLDGPARQGRPARLRRELRAGRGPGLVLLAPDRRRARPRHRPAAGRRLLRRAAPSSPRRRSAASAGWRTPPCRRGSGSTASGATTSSSASDRLTLTRGVQARRLAGGRRHAGEPAGVAGGLDLLPLRQDLRPPQPRLPRPGLRPAADARPVRARGAAPPRARQAPTGLPLFAEVDLISSHAPWTRIPPLIAWDDVGDGSIFHRLPVRRPSGHRCSATPTGPAPPTAVRSSTR